MAHLVTVASEHAATWALTLATLHLAHRSLPEERKHWLRQRTTHVVKRCTRRKGDDR